MTKWLRGLLGAYVRVARLRRERDELRHQIEMLRADVEALPAEAGKERR